MFIVVTFGGSVVRAYFQRGAFFVVVCICACEGEGEY